MPESEDHAEKAPLRDAFQFMGAVLFVMGMLAIGWRAAHESGVWPG